MKTRENWREKTEAEEKKRNRMKMLMPTAFDLKGFVIFLLVWRTNSYVTVSVH